MCVALYRPASHNVARVTEDQWLEIATMHNDSAGVCWREAGALHLYRTADTLGAAEVWDMIDWCQDKGHAFIAHVRTATSGGSSAKYAHPFPLWNDRAALVHNGILHEGWTGKLLKREKRAGIPKDASDTARFTEWLNASGERWATSPEGRKAIATQLGIGNRLAILLASGRVELWGGHWNDGIWWSNHDYEWAGWVKEYKAERKDYWRGSWDTPADHLGWTRASAKYAEPKALTSGAVEDDIYSADADVPPIDFACQQPTDVRLARWEEMTEGTVTPDETARVA